MDKRHSLSQKSKIFASSLKEGAKADRFDLSGVKLCNTND